LVDGFENGGNGDWKEGEVLLSLDVGDPWEGIVNKGDVGEYETEAKLVVCDELEFGRSKGDIDEVVVERVPITEW